MSDQPSMVKTCRPTRAGRNEPRQTSLWPIVIGSAMPLALVDCLPQEVRGQHAVSVGEHVRRHIDRFADEPLDGKAALIDRWAHPLDGEPGGAQRALQGLAFVCPAGPDEVGPLELDNAHFAGS